MMYSLSVTDAGVSMRYVVKGVARKRKVKPGKRKACVGMSSAARRRLCRWLIGWHVPGRDIWGVTLTLRHHISADVWRVNFKRFCARSVELGHAWVWRVELQRRGVPHLHLIAWGSEDDMAALQALWLRVWGLDFDSDAQRYGTNCRAINAGWFSYVIFHQIKGGAYRRDGGIAPEWHGRHWGVVGRRLFSERNRMDWCLSDVEYDRVQAILRRYMRRAGRRHVTRYAGYDHVADDWGFLVARVVQHVRSKRVGSPGSRG